MFGHREQAGVARRRDDRAAGRRSHGHSVTRRAGIGGFFTRSARHAWAAVFASTVMSMSLIASPQIEAKQKMSNKRPPIDERQLQPTVRGTYKVFRAKCGKCHTTERVLRAKYDTLEKWQECIARMAKLRGANISLEEQGQVRDFFAFYLKHFHSPKPTDKSGAPERENEAGKKEEPKQKEPGA